jgi:hypothetical protein
MAAHRTCVGPLLESLGRLVAAGLLKVETTEYALEVRFLIVCS